MNWISLKTLDLKSLSLFVFGVMFGAFITGFLPLDGYKSSEFGHPGFFMKHGAVIQERPSNSVRLLCWITTMPSNHRTKAVHIKSTWASRCDGYIFMSSVDDPSLPAVAAVQSEGRERLWRKTEFALKYIWKHFGNDFDFFYKADDDTYAIIDNLRLLLMNYDPHVPVLLGHTHLVHVKSGYPSGGAGYVMSWAALRLFFYGMQNVTACYDSTHDYAEDIKVGYCAEALNISLVHSVDERGISRFYYLSPFMKLTESGLNAPLTFIRPNAFFICCASNQVSFHYIKPEELYFLDYLLYTVRAREPQ